MKTGAMRRFVGIDAEGSEPSKTKQIAKRVGHGVESVRKNIRYAEKSLDLHYLRLLGCVSSSYSLPGSCCRCSDSAGKLIFLAGHTNSVLIDHPIV